MVICSADCQRFHSVLSCDSTHVGQEARFEILIKGESLLRTEDVMNKVAHVGVWHRCSPLFSRPLRGLFGSFVPSPSDKSLGYFHNRPLCGPGNAAETGPFNA